MSPDFESLREQLLRAGIAPGRVRRYVRELQDHLDDLVEQGRASGLAPGEAREQAMVLLGGEAELAGAMTRSASMRSFAARAPWAVFVVSPFLALVVALLGFAVLMMNVLWPVRGLALAEMPQNYRALIDLADVVANYAIGLSVAGICIAAALRQRIASGWVWAALAIIAVLNGALGFHAHDLPSHPGFKGGAVYSLVDTVYVHGRVSLAATVGLEALRTSMLFAIAGTAYKVLRSRLCALQSP